ncbi:MAG: hypothetical protein FJX42_06810 [Alphaproteobacteria bacterium]|nr:hypothetical protein [Alphaproteobacteria bacterium]
MAEAVAVARNGTSSHEGSEVGILRDRYTVYPARPLAHLDLPTAKAFVAEDNRDKSHKLFALVCSPDTPPRSHALAALKGTQARGLLPLVDYGPVSWSPSGRKCTAVIYEQPLGGRVSELIHGNKVRLTEHDIARRVIEPLVNALHTLAGLGIPHREIRPSNMFFLDENREQIVLGDCATVPPGFDQPILFEPIERGLTAPAGRGEGELRDDIYALGVSIVALLFDALPAAKLNDDDLLSSKIEHGSSGAISHNVRLPLPLLEPLRGMLSDHVSERWGLDQTDSWLDGRKMTPMQRRTSTKTDTPMVFAGRSHITARTLARSMTQHVAEAAKFLRETDLDPWLRRALADPDTADRVKMAVDQARANPSASTSTDDHMVTRVALSLDPRGPIRYKGFSYLPEAFSTAMAVEILKRGGAQNAVETIIREYPVAWYNHPVNFGPETPAATRLFTQIRAHLQNNDYGYGVERCMYDGSLSMPCQSPLIGDEYVTRIEELLPALDRAASKVDPKTRPMDRHIAAFIAVRFHQDIEPHLKALSSARTETSLVGMLSLLAFVQWRLKLGELPGLAGWIGGLLGPAINTYLSRSTRREIEKEVPRLVRQGSLPELFNLIDNADKRRLDHEGYAAAQAEFAAAEVEIKEIEGSGSEHSQAMIKGQRTAAAIAVILMFVVITFVLILQR